MNKKKEKHTTLKQRKKIEIKNTITKNNKKNKRVGKEKKEEQTIKD